MNFEKFEAQIGVSFGDKSLLRQAFTHRSYINENKNSRMHHNERLEFLGDAVLELITTHFLYEKYPDSSEGDLTSYRAAMVNAVTLSSIADRLGMNDFLLLSKGEAKDTGRARRYILANAFEALVGAIYMDQGYKVTEKFISRELFPMMGDIISKKLWLDAKSFFQEQAQEITGITPLYRLIKESGPDHDKHFTVGVYLDKELVASGEGKSKQEAEQDAALNALEA